MLTRQNADEKLKWATEKVGWGRECEKVIYSDEKKFNTDGPDDWCRYWRDFRKDEKHLCRRHTGGGGVWNGPHFRILDKWGSPFVP